MKLVTTITRTSAKSFAGASVLVLQLLSIIQMPLLTNASVLSNKVVPICEEGCHCFGSEGKCPQYPTITENMIPTYRALNHTNPMRTLCNPFLSSSCVSTLEQGEACVVVLIAPTETTESSCPSEYSYRLKTVPSLENATAEGQYVTHTGACGTCSSLQDLSLMISYPNLPYKAQQCFFASTALKYVEKAVTCYQEIGFTRSCSQTLAYHQKRIVDKNCGYQCAAWSYDGDLGRPSCQDVSGCGACVDRLGISAQLELVAGRTFANSGYPSQKARQCSDIAPLSVIGGSDICSEAPLAQFPTEGPLVSKVPSMTAGNSTTVSPTTEPVQLPTVAPLPVPSAAPTENSPVATVSPIDPTLAPVASLSFHKCLKTAGIENRTNTLLGGNGVFCDCSEAESGVTDLPKCYSSPDRDDSSACFLVGSGCNESRECCSRKCDGRQRCYRGGRTDKNNYRISTGFGGAGGGAQRGQVRFRPRP